MDVVVRGRASDQLSPMHGEASLSAMLSRELRTDRLRSSDSHNHSKAQKKGPHSHEGLKFSEGELVISLRTPG